MGTTLTSKKKEGINTAFSINLNDMIQCYLSLSILSTTRKPDDDVLQTADKRSKQKILNITLSDYALKSRYLFYFF